MPSRALLIPLGLVLMALGATPAVAQVYRLVMPDGTTHFTNAPTDPKYQRLQVTSGTAAGWLRLPGAEGGRYATEIRRAAARYGVPEKLVSAVIRVESGFNPRAVSRKGARGLMQLMPETASGLGVRDTFDPRENIDGGVRHLHGLMERFANNLPLVLAAYNAGERAVTGYGGIPPYPETRDYVRRVLQLVDGGVLDGSAHPVYRTVAEDGTVTYTNIPPRVRH